MNTKSNALVRGNGCGFVAHGNPPLVEMVREYGQKSTLVETCNSAVGNLSRTISRTIISGPLWARFFVPGQLLNELHRALFWEVRESAPHDFGAFLLAQEAACVVQRGSNHLPRFVVCGRRPRQAKVGRRLLRKFPQNRIPLHTNVLKVAVAVGSDLAETPRAHSAAAPTNAYF